MPTDRLKRPWPEPTETEPDVDTFIRWEMDGDNEATDGCRTEPDGRCEHGHVSWLLWLGMI